ncbi:protein RETICULATA-RELATED 1, chloroplastic-like isoform X3 [Magnolia sinica]|uniref:protein RETICULATA-RELATED 1, chloroplastic-like isoform X3 n=1 Tax=Magnolia sinica TaxID=86752 RepID=UPI002658D597|nr:protein RETICULATA-RELATED 1, chloroplastic-like isoform X3 [Magnolia sinica]
MCMIGIIDLVGHGVNGPTQSENQDSVWPLGVAIKSCSLLCDQMLADPSFLFKVATKVVIDSCCGMFAEVKKRGKDFWAEFELFLADLLVGVVVDIALVGLLAPYVRIGKPFVSKGFFGHMQRVSGALPSSVFEAERPGSRFSVGQRVGTYFYKGVLYGSVGFFCGIIGQGIANLVMTAKRSIKKSEEDIPVPPLLKSAALWGMYNSHVLDSTCMLFCYFLQLEGIGVNWLIPSVSIFYILFGLFYEYKSTQNKVI